MLKNDINSCSESKWVASFKNSLAFKDSEAYQVKVYNPVYRVVTIQVRSGPRGNEDGTAKSCTFVQPHGICTIGETIFATNAATGNVKLITEMSGTTQFLKHLGLLYDSFGITCKGSVAQDITQRQKVENLIKRNNYLKSIVSKVKEDNNLKEMATTNGPQGTVSRKMQQNLEFRSGFLFQIAGWKVQPLLCLLNQYSRIHIIRLCGFHFRQWREYSPSPCR